MSSPETNDLAAVVEALRSHDRFLVTTHENPDGDALGSLSATKLALEQLGKDVVMVLKGDSPLPGEYAFMALEGLKREWPEDVESRALLALDCANESRIADPAVLGRAPLVLNVDHHHDNTRFGTVDLVVSGASSTGEVLRDVFQELGVRLTPEIAEALYIALVTDTGRFQYTNTTPKALRLAAELVEAGADVHRIFQGVYESVQFAKLKLLARALDRAQVYEGGRIVVSYLLRTDFAEVGAAEPYAEGIIDYLRAVEGAQMAVLIREPPRRGRQGPLHPSGIVLVDKPSGPSSFALVRELRSRTGARTGHAGTLDPFASGLLLLLSGSATKLASCFVGLDKRYLAEIDLTARTSTGDPEGDVVEHAEPPSREALEQRLADLRGEVELPIPAASAVKIGGERAYKLARRGIEVDMPLRRSRVDALDVIAYTNDAVTLDLRVSSGTYVRAIAEAIGE